MCPGATQLDGGAASTPSVYAHVAIALGPKLGSERAPVPWSNVPMRIGNEIGRTAAGAASFPEGR
jgi:hypothetical protein